MVETLIPVDPANGDRALVVGFFRHGEGAHQQQSNQLLIADTHAPLTDAGWEQSHTIPTSSAKALDILGMDNTEVDLLVSSGYLRSIQTLLGALGLTKEQYESLRGQPNVAERTAEALGESLIFPSARTTLLDKRFSERFRGEQGLMPDQFAENHPVSAAMKTIDPGNWQPPGGWSMADMEAVKVTLVFDLLPRITRETRAALFVIHGELIRALLGRIRNQNYAETYEVETSPERRIVPNAAGYFLSRVDPDSGLISKRYTHLITALPGQEPVVETLPGRRNYGAGDLVTLGHQMERQADMMRSRNPST